MLKKIFLLLIFYNQGVSCQENNSIEVVYKIIVEDFSENEIANMKNEKIKNIVLEKMNNTKNKEFLLIGNYKNAYFKKINTLRSDLISRDSDYSGNEEYYYDIESKKIFVLTELGGKKHLVYYPFDYYNWVITNETKNIDGYICYKALGVQKIDDFRGKREYELEAWFCPSLPYNYGPSIYYGLPGLVFEAFTHKGKIKYVIKSLKFSNNNQEILKPKYEEISNKEFTEIFNLRMKNMTNRN